MMSGIRGKNTRPELLLRSALHRLGFRYRLHSATLPGRPDIVLPKYGAAVMVNGCFWHGHNCHLFRMPDTRREFWQQKIENNRRRDSQNLEALHSAGWRTLTVWECAMRPPRPERIDEIARKVSGWLADGSPSGEITGEAPGT